MTTIPNDKLYADTFSDFVCNATLGSYVDTPTEIMYQWSGPEMLNGDKYIISNNNTTLRITGFNVMLHNNMNITCTVSVVSSPGLQYMYVLPNNASENRLLIVEGEY